MSEFKGKEWSRLVRFEHEMTQDNNGNPVVVIKNTVELYKTHDGETAVEVIKRTDNDGNEAFTMAVDGTEVEHKEAEKIFLQVSDGTKEDLPPEKPTPTEEEAKQKSDDVIKEIETALITGDTNGDTVKN